MKNDRAAMFNQPVKIDLTRSFHHCVNIVGNKAKNMQCDDQALATAEDVTPKKTGMRMKKASVRMKYRQKKMKFSRKTQNPDEAS